MVKFNFALKFIKNAVIVFRTQYVHNE